jgi:hypothetical protein
LEKIFPFLKKRCFSPFFRLSHRLPAAEKTFSETFDMRFTHTGFHIPRIESYSRDSPFSAGPASRPRRAESRTPGIRQGI